MQISAKTPVYCVIGHPVGHSLSPVMHNTAFAAARRPGVYVAFDTADAAGAAAALRTLGICGASITIPHKVDIMARLDETDPHAETIGAVNTVVNAGGKLSGYNTDGLGAVRALEETAPVSGRKVLVLGAGGAARAVCFALMQAGGRIFIANRTYEKGRQLAQDLGAEPVLMQELRGGDYDILVNTTPAGMHPKTDAVPVPASVLHPDMHVMDIIYNPLRTRLLLEAEKRGCTVTDGTKMFVYQGAAQFSLWTGLDAPIEQMRHAVLNHLSV